MNGGPAREPILGALVELVAAEGYLSVTTDCVLERAGVSQVEFDALFPDLESAMLEALDAAADRAIRRVRHVAAQAARDLPIRAGAEQRIDLVFEPALRALLECAAGAPDVTRVCVVEVATIGARGLARRDAALERFVQLLESTLPDLPNRPSQLASEMVVGGIHELLQRRARLADTDRLPELAPELAAIWLPVLTGAR
jgi:AcrR family transcriptional regulator